MISHRATLIAVLIALMTGLLASLALRPPGQAPTTSHSGQDIQTKGVEAPIIWRMPLSLSGNLPVLGTSPEYTAERLRRISAGGINLELYDPGEVVPAFAITDAVRDHKVEIGFTWLGYDQGKIPSSALLAATPFGMEPWEFTAWWYHAGGRELGEALYAKHNIKPLLCGIIGPETAGWFRQPVESLDDVQGLKIRFAGIGGKVMQRAGASVTMLPGSEIFQALEKGAIDATEFSLPVTDQVLGFHRVAKNNYYPGWHQPFTSLHMVINLETWKNLSLTRQAQFEAGCMAGVTYTLAEAEATQGQIIAGFPELGVAARSLPDDVLRELERITTEVMDEEAAKDPDFFTILSAQRKFSAQYAHWKRLAFLPRTFQGYAE